MSKGEVLIFKEVELFFARQHDDHMQKYRWHKFTSQFKEISTDELLREAGLRK